MLSLFTARWPRIVGFAWWNEAWENDDNPTHNTTLRVQDIPNVADVLQTQLADNSDKLQESPVFVGTSLVAADR